MGRLEELMRAMAMVDVSREIDGDLIGLFCFE